MFIVVLYFEDSVLSLSMPKKSLKSSTELSSFAKLVEKALNLSRDIKRLGSESPLAAPYLLANYLEKEDVTARNRGRSFTRCY